MNVVRQSENCPTSELEFLPVVEKLLGFIPNTPEPQHNAFETEIPSELLLPRIRKVETAKKSEIKERVHSGGRIKWLMGLMLTAGVALLTYAAIDHIPSLSFNLESLPDSSSVLEMERVYVSGNELNGMISDLRWESMTTEKKMSVIHRLEYLYKAFGVRKLMLRDMTGAIVVYTMCSREKCQSFLEAAPTQR